MTHDKMINCWKLYLFAFIDARTGANVDLPTQTIPEECAAVALGVHHGKVGDGPLAFVDFSKVLSAQILGADIGTIP